MLTAGQQAGQKRDKSGTGGKVPVDIELLLQWAIGQTGQLPWRGVSPRELMFDHGYTVVPKGCARTYRDGGIVLARAIDGDAAAVVEAIKALEPAVAAVVVACARTGIRPDWMPGIQPRLVQVTKRHRRKHRRIVVAQRWDPCEPGAIRMAREAYRQWHRALGRLAFVLRDCLDAWTVNGFAAPPAPWEEADKKQA